MMTLDDPGMEKAVQEVALERDEPPEKALPILLLLGIQRSSGARGLGACSRSGFPQTRERNGKIGS
jgi:hypothetical protein